MTRLSWVTLHSIAHSFIELDKAVIHVISLVSFLWLWFSVCPLMDKDKRLVEASWWKGLAVGESGFCLLVHFVWSVYFSVSMLYFNNDNNKEQRTKNSKDISEKKLLWFPNLLAQWHMNYTDGSEKSKAYVGFWYMTGVACQIRAGKWISTWKQIKMGSLSHTIHKIKDLNALGN